MQLNIGKKIKELRKAQNRSLDDLSKVTGVGKATLSRLENGKVGGNIATLKKIADALNITLDSLVEGAELKKEEVFNVMSKQELKDITRRLISICKTLNIDLEK